MANKWKLDVAGFEKQVEQLKKKIAQGAVEGLNNSQDLMVGIMKVMMEDIVYKSYDPVMYERSGDLLNSLKAKVEGNTLYIYSDGSQLDKMDNGLPYSYRVLYGHDTYPYQYLPKDGSRRSYMEERNWIESTREELISMTNQSQKFLDVVRQAIQQRIG